MPVVTQLNTLPDHVIRVTDKDPTLKTATAHRLDYAVNVLQQVPNKNNMMIYILITVSNLFTTLLYQQWINLLRGCVEENTKHY